MSTDSSIPTVIPMSESTAPRELRVSTAEREHVAGLLGNHVAAGRLSPDEYAERMQAASAAVTRSQLNTLMLDLPGATVPDSLVTDVLELHNTAGDLKRNGKWVVPATISIRTKLGNARIDFSEARFTTPIVTVDANVGVGNVDLVIPDGATVDLDEARTTIGTIADKTVTSFERGTPHIVVRGGTMLGNISVRHGKQRRP
jgi:hypothetical protein